MPSSLVWIYLKLIYLLTGFLVDGKARERDRIRVCCRKWCMMGRNGETDKREGEGWIEGGRVQFMEAAGTPHQYTCAW